MIERDFVGYGANPPHPRWPGDARLALNFVINYEEGSEPAIPDGDKASDSRGTEATVSPVPHGVRDLAAESMFEYGSRVGFWRLARQFKERGLPLTVFACARAIERNPEVAEWIRQSRSDVCCHGLRWIEHFRLSEDEERRQIAEAVKSLERTLGEPPLGWYCRFGPSANTRKLVVEHGGFVYDSDAYNDELPYWTWVLGQRHLVVPYSLVTNDMKFANSQLRSAGDFFELLRDAFDVLYREGREHPRMMSVGLHNRIAGHPGRAAGLFRFLDHVARHEGVWVCRRIEIARHWQAREGSH